MIQNQLARRNVDNWIKINLGFRMEDYIVAKAKENISNAVSASNIKRSENPSFLISGKLENKVIKPVHTERELAKLAGVGHDTIYKAKEIKTKAPAEILPDLERNIISH
jgi:hypothetical protein